MPRRPVSGCPSKWRRNIFTWVLGWRSQPADVGCGGAGAPAVEVTRGARALAREWLGTGWIAHRRQTPWRTVLGRRWARGDLLCVEQNRQRKSDMLWARLQAAGSSRFFHAGE